MWETLKRFDLTTTPPNDDACSLARDRCATAPNPSTPIGDYRTSGVAARSVAARSAGAIASGERVSSGATIARRRFAIWAMNGSRGSVWRRFRSATADRSGSAPIDAASAVFRLCRVGALSNRVFGAWERVSQRSSRGRPFGVDLVTKMRSDNEGREFGAVLAGLERDIRQDRDTLYEVVEVLGAKPDRFKQASGWAIEKLSRIVFAYRFTGSKDLSRLMQTEALSLGIEGKLAGWCALKELADADLGVDLDALIARAADQRRRLEPFRIAAAKRAFEGAQARRQPTPATQRAVGER